MSRPTIGVSMLYCLDKPFKKATENIKELGISHIELHDEGLHVLNKPRIRVLSDLAACYKISFSMHAPFIGVNISSSSDWMWRAIIKRLKKSILRAEMLSCDVWVFHPGTRSYMDGLLPGRELRRTLKTSVLLFRFARDHRIRAVIENLPESQSYGLKTVDDFHRFYAEIGEDIELVLDIGHANTVGEVDSFLGEFPDKIGHIHAHDNDGKSDTHLGVGYGTVNWKRTAILLKKNSYRKTIIVESVEHVSESVERLRQLLS